MLIHEKYWNFKKYPVAVFYYMPVLIVMGFGLLVIQAIMELYINHDVIYLLILLAGIGLLVFGLWPVRKILWPMINHDMNKEK